MADSVIHASGANSIETVDPVGAVFHFCHANRSYAIRNHRALLNGTREKLFPVFDDASIRAEADTTADRAFERFIHQPKGEFDYIDLGGLAEDALEEGLDCYLDLIFVKGQLHALSVAALYHLWERTLKKFIILELRTEGLTNRKSRVEKAGFANLIDILAALGFNVREESYFDTLEVVSLVANVCKHGDGPSFVKLQEKAPELFSGQNEWRYQVSEEIPEFIKPTADDLWITPIRFEELGDSIEEFWRSMPEYLHVPRNWYRSHQGQG